MQKNILLITKKFTCRGHQLSEYLRKLNGKHNQYNDIQEIKNTLLLENNIELELIYNKSYLKCLMELRDVSSSITKELMSPVLRLYQIEEKLKKHISKLPKINVNLQTGLKNEY